MSSSSLLRRSFIAALALTAMSAVAACTMTPVYGPAGAEAALALNFATPNTPLEQIVYQDLGRRFGTSSAPDAPVVSIAVLTASRTLAQSVTSDPAKDMLMTATGTVKITKGGRPVLTATRQATATYASGGQVLADDSAAIAAGEQAAHALADTLELTITAALAPQAATAGQ
jgi:hypothetical protein